MAYYTKELSAGYLCENSCDQRELCEYGDYNDFALVLQPTNFDTCVTGVYKQASLQEIYGEFGQSALDFTGELYEQGLVALAWSICARATSLHEMFLALISWRVRAADHLTISDIFFPFYVF